MFTKNKTKFHWLAKESANRDFPMRIIDGTFYYRNEDFGLYIPTAASISKGWGEGSSSHVVGDDFKPLPDRLEIRFYSFWENKLYHGSFDLPYEKILALFKEGVARDKEYPTFRNIIAGVAPGGAVAVWVTGKGESREVFFGQATAYEADMRDPMGSPIEDTTAYAERNLKYLPPETYNRIKKEGIPFGIWEEYRKKYNWNFAVPTEKKVSSIGVSFFNGESFRTDFPFNDQNAEKPIPLGIGFGALFLSDPKRYVYGINFDYDETDEAMQKLSNEGKEITIIVNPTLPKTSSTISLTNGKETIELKKITHDD